MARGAKVYVAGHRVFWARRWYVVSDARAMRDFFARERPEYYAPGPQPMQEGRS